MRHVVIIQIHALVKPHLIVVGAKLIQITGVIPGIISQMVMHVGDVERGIIVPDIQIMAYMNAQTDLQTVPTQVHQLLTVVLGNVTRIMNGTEVYVPHARGHRQLMQVTANP